MRTSRFVNLSSYCVVEYMFDQLGSLNFYTDDFILIENANADTHQIFNDDSSYHITKNIKDLTAVPIGKKRRFRTFLHGCILIALILDGCTYGLIS
jgi:hypothetical protein